MATIKITVGSKNDHYGKTTFEAAADGQVLVLNEQYRDQQKLSGRISPEMVNELYNQLQEHKGLNTMSQRKGTAHEAIYEIQFSDQQGESGTITIWQNDLKKYPAIKSVIESAKEIVRKSSDGKVRL